MGWWVTILGMVGDHQWQLLPELDFVSQVYVQNFKYVVHFLLVDFGEGCYLLLVTCSCDGGKTKSTPSPTDLDWTVRLDWSLTKIP